MEQNKKIEHLYIHWPFCKKKCSYCDFISFPKHEEFIHKYHGRLCDEIIEFSKKNKDIIGHIKTIFFGGGTPSLYPLPLLQELFSVLHKHFYLKDLIEVTIEANPGDVTEEHLKVWKDLGINRLSIGVQMLDEKILKNVNREQKDQDVIKLLELAPKYFNNISIDLMLGLPGATKENWYKTLNTAIKWPLNHISVYFLTIYEKTPLYFKIKSGEISTMPEDELIELYTDTIDFLKSHNFGQYEISNFSKPGCESLHNQAYWDRRFYRGFGLSAASFYKNNRLVNAHALTKYLNSKDSSYSTNENLDPEADFLEEVMLGLRQTKGIDLQRVIYFLYRVKEGQTGQVDDFMERIKNLKACGLIEEKNGKIFLTIRGMVLENEVTAYLVS